MKSAATLAGFTDNTPSTIMNKPFKTIIFFDNNSHVAADLDWYHPGEHEIVGRFEIIPSEWKGDIRPALKRLYTLIGESKATVIVADSFPTRLLSWAYNDALSAIQLGDWRGPLVGLYQKDQQSNLFGAVGQIEVGEHRLSYLGVSLSK